MGKIFFTADLHFSHANVIKYCSRPFKDVEEMNEGLIKNWNETITVDDTVFVLGDFSLSFTSVEKYLWRLNGKKILIAGNHDTCHPAHHKSKKEERRKEWIQKYIDAGFSEVHLGMSFDIPGLGYFMLYHLPYHDPQDVWADGKIRYEQFRLPDSGIPLLCGHVHEKFAFKRTPKGTPMLNVGVDSPGTPWYMHPASLEEIIEFYQRMQCI